MSNNKAVVIIMICYFLFMLFMLKFETNKTKPESIHSLAFQPYNLSTKGFECTNTINIGFPQFPSKECSLRGSYE